MAASKHQMNWTSVSFAANPITRVTQVRFSQGGKVVTAAADDDQGPSLAVVPSQQPTATVDSYDVAVLMGIAPGTTGAFAATHKDAKKASGGDILYELDPAVAENADAGGSYAQFGSASINFVGIFSDGETNPLSFTRA